MLAAGLIQKLADSRKGVNDRLILGHFAIEDAQRISHGPPLTIDTHLTPLPAPTLSAMLRCRQRDRWGSQRIQLKIPTLDPQPVEQCRQHLQHLRVAYRRLASRRRRAQALRPDLIELPVAPLLWTLAPELGTDIVNFCNPRSQSLCSM